MFGSLVRFGEEDDDFLGAQMQSMNQMSQMMNSMFANPFGMMGGMGGMGGFGGSPFMPPMMPQMPNMNQMMSQMQNNGNCHSFSSSTVMSMSNGPDGRPQVYQATSSTRSAPGGIRETKKAVCDSRTGLKKMAIGHAIGDKAHIIEREQNMRSGEQEERQDFINLDEEESAAFNQEWQHKAREAQLLQHSLEYPQRRHSGRGQEPQLALTDCNSSSNAEAPRQLKARHQSNSGVSGHHRQRQPVVTHPRESATEETTSPVSRKRDHSDLERTAKPTYENSSDDETDRVEIVELTESESKDEEAASDGEYSPKKQKTGE